MNFFQSFEDVINACHSYDLIIKKAQKETEEDESSMVSCMTDMIHLADLKARRFLNQFGQYEKYMDGDLYAVIPYELLQTVIVSRTNFTVLKKYETKEGTKAVLKFSPGTKFPMVLVNSNIGQERIEELREMNLVQKALIHLVPLIEARRNGKPVCEFLNKKPAEVIKPADGSEAAPKAKEKKRELGINSIKELREFIKLNDAPTEKDATKRPFDMNGGKLSFVDFRSHVVGLSEVYQKCNDKYQFTSVINRAFYYYHNKQAYTKLSEFLEANVGEGLPDINSESKSKTDLIKAQLLNIRNSGDDNDQTQLINEKNISDYMWALEFEEYPTPEQKDLIRTYRSMNRKAFYETVIRIENQNYRLPSTESKCLDRGFINTRDANGQKLSDVVRAKAEEVGIEKNWTPLQIEVEYKLKLGELIASKITDEATRSSNDLAEIDYSSHGKQNKLFPVSADLPPNFSIEEYFSDPQLIAMFNQCNSEPTPNRVQQQSALIEAEIKRLGSTIEVAKIAKINQLLEQVKEGNLDTITIESVGEYFTDPVRAKLFTQVLSQKAPSELSEGNLQMKESNEVFSQNRATTMISLLSKELSALRNVDKVLRLVELRSMIDPTSSLFWISNVYQKVEEAMRIKHLARELEKSIVSPLRLTEIPISDLPAQLQLMLISDEDAIAVEEEVEETESASKPEEFYHHDITAPKKQSKANPGASVYLMDQTKFELLKVIVSDVGIKYNRILTERLEQDNTVRSSDDNSALSLLIGAYKLVTGYFNLPVGVHLNYNAVLSANFIRKINNIETSFKDIAQDKLYDGQIIVPMIYKKYIDILIGLGYSPTEGVGELSEKSIDDEANEAEDIERKAKEIEAENPLGGFERAEAYRKSEYAKLDQVYDGTKNTVWDSITEMTIESEIATNPNDSFWGTFTEFKDKYLGFMTTLKATGYEFLISGEDPIGKLELDSEVARPSKVSGDRGDGTFSLQPAKANDTRRIFPKEFEPIVTMYAVDENGEFLLDDENNRIEKGTVSLLTPEFWQQLILMSAQAKKEILSIANDKIKELTIFGETEDYVRLAEEVNRRAGVATKRPFDVNLLKGEGEQTTLQFSDVFNESKTSYVEKRNKALSNVKVEPVANFKKLFKLYATPEQQDNKNKLDRKLKNIKQNTARLNPEDLSNAVHSAEAAKDEYVRTVVTSNPQYKKNNEDNLDQNLTSADEFISNVDLVQHYKDLAYAKLPSVIAKAIMLNVLSQSSELQGLITDNSELRDYMSNKIKFFVLAWISMHKTEESFGQQVDNLLLPSKLAFNYDEILKSYRSVYREIPNDSKILGSNNTNKIEKLNDVKDKLNRRRILWFLMNREERAAEGIEMDAYFDQDYVDCVIENAASETYQVDQMICNFAKNNIERVINAEPLPPSLVVVKLTDLFLESVQVGGPKYEEFNCYSAIAARLNKDKIESYSTRSKEIGGSIRLFVLDRMTKLADDYLAPNTGGKSLIHDKKRHDESFSSKINDKEVANFIYDLVNPQLENMDDLTKEKLLKEGRDSVVGRISLVLDSNTAGVILDTTLEKILNLVVGEVHNLDTQIYLKLKDNVAAARKERQTEIQSRDQEGVEEPFEFDLEQAKEGITTSVIKEGKTLMNKLVANIQGSIVDLERLSDENYARDLSDSENTDYASGFVLNDVVGNYVNQRAGEMYAVISDDDADSTYSFDSKSPIIINTIMKLMPLHEFARYDYSPEDVLQMVEQSVNDNSFKTFDKKNRVNYRITSLNIKKHMDRHMKNLSKMNTNRVESETKSLVRAFLLMESSLFQYLKATKSEFKQDDEVAVSKDKEAAWVQRSLDLFLGSSLEQDTKEPDIDTEQSDLSLKRYVETKRLSNVEQAREKRIEAERELLKQSSKEYKSLLVKLGIKDNSEEMKVIKKFITNEINELSQRTLVRNLNSGNKQFVDLILSILKERFREEIILTGNNEDKLRALILENINTFAAKKNKGTDQASNLKQVIKEKENPVDKSFSLETYDHVSSFGTDRSKTVIVLMDKLIPLEIINLAKQLRDSGCQNLEDVKNKIADEATRNTILQKYDDNGIVRLLQLSNLINVSQLIEIDKDNYYVKIKASQIGDVKYREVDGPLEDAHKSWGRNKVSQPIMDIEWKGKIYDVVDKEGNPVINPETDQTEIRTRLIANIKEESQLDAQLANDKDTDFLFETVQNYNLGSVAAKSKDSKSVHTLSDFFGKANENATIGKTAVNGLYRATIMSADNLCDLKSFLRALVYDTKVFHNKAVEPTGKKSKRHPGLNFDDFSGQLNLSAQSAASEPDAPLPDTKSSLVAKTNIINDESKLKGDSKSRAVNEDLDSNVNVNPTQSSHANVDDVAQRVMSQFHADSGGTTVSELVDTDVGQYYEPGDENAVVPVPKMFGGSGRKTPNKKVLDINKIDKQIKDELGDLKVPTKKKNKKQTKNTKKEPPVFGVPQQTKEPTAVPAAKKDKKEKKEPPVFGVPSEAKPTLEMTDEEKANLDAFD